MNYSVVPLGGQSQFDLNRNQAQSGTISNTNLFGD